MGLDSWWYMRKTTYAHDAWDGTAAEKAAALRRYPKELKEINKERKGRPQTNCTRIVDEKFKIGYFRKFNAMHGWLVKNAFQGDEYNGQDIVLTKEDAKKLMGACAEVLAAKDKGEAAMEWLPPTSGFFFGNQDIDGYYIECVENLHTMLSRTIREWNELENQAKKGEVWSLVYAASY